MRRLLTALLGAFLLSLCFASTAAAGPVIAALELYNGTGENLPRVGEYSEKKLTETLESIEGLQVLPRMILARTLVQGRFPVSQLHADPALAGEMGREAGADYVVTGKITAYEMDLPYHSLEVDLRVIDADRGTFAFAERYRLEVEVPAARKQHRELLDLIFEEAAGDLQAFFQPDSAAPAEEAERPDEG